MKNEHTENKWNPVSVVPPRADEMWSKTLLVKTKTGLTVYGHALLSDKGDSIHDWFILRDLNDVGSQHSIDGHIVIEWMEAPTPEHIVKCVNEHDGLNTRNALLKGMIEDYIFKGTDEMIREQIKELMKFVEFANEYIGSGGNVDATIYQTSTILIEKYGDK